MFVRKKMFFISGCCNFALFPGVKDPSGDWMMKSLWMGVIVRSIPVGVWWGGVSTSLGSHLHLLNHHEAHRGDRTDTFPVKDNREWPEKWIDSSICCITIKGIFLYAYVGLKQPLFPLALDVFHCCHSDLLCLLCACCPVFLPPSISGCWIVVVWLYRLLTKSFMREFLSWDTWSLPFCCVKLFPCTESSIGVKLIGIDMFWFISSQTSCFCFRAVLLYSIFTILFYMHFSIHYLTNFMSVDAQPHRPLSTVKANHWPWERINNLHFIMVFSVIIVCYTVSICRMTIPVKGRTLAPLYTVYIKFVHINYHFTSLPFSTCSSQSTKPGPNIPTSMRFIWTR